MEIQQTPKSLSNLRITNSIDRELKLQMIFITKSHQQCPFQQAKAHQCSIQLTAHTIILLKIRTQEQGRLKRAIPIYCRALCPQLNYLIKKGRSSRNFSKKRNLMKTDKYLERFLLLEAFNRKEAQTPQAIMQRLQSQVINTSN